jgi:hypothetical protein
MHYAEDYAEWLFHHYLSKFICHVRVFASNEMKYHSPAILWDDIVHDCYFVVSPRIKMVIGCCTACFIGFRLVATYSVSPTVHAVHSTVAFHRRVRVPPPKYTRCKVTLHTSFVYFASHFVLRTLIKLLHYRTLWRKLRSLHPQELPRTIFLLFLGFL